MRRLFWISILLLTSGCLNSADSKQVDAAFVRLFSEIQAKQYDVIYDEAAPELQTSMPKDTFVAMLQRVDRKLGACPAPTTPTNWRVNATTGGYFAARSYALTCANGQMTESLTLVLRNGQAKLAGYNASSPLLLTD
jgi:hypothetical protein